jgi:tetratricopeptide (TPR) repeat protein/MinD-like ATPase involved in chromosome partitioning or flagellar assembly
MGKVVTFYSYKGGVGRSMALANVAVLLAQWGYKVLIVDWDLEAPGIEQYFKQFIDLRTASNHKGVVDLLEDIASGRIAAPEQLNWRDYILEIGLQNVGEQLHIITAGSRTEQYFYRLRQVDVQRLYDENKGGLFIEYLRNEWKSSYDYTLIDSRTGITDIGGICTVHLPDLLILLFTATEQSLKGVIDVHRKVLEARQKLPFDRVNLVSVPIPSRFDTQTEFEISQEWLDRFSTELTEIYKDWMPISIQKRKLLEITKIPYVSYFSFGEKLPVLEQGTTDPASLGYAYETLAAMIANQLEFVENLIDDRSSFIKTILRKRKLTTDYDVSLSFAIEDRSYVEKVADALKELGVRIFFDQFNEAELWGKDLYSYLEEMYQHKARYNVLFISKHFIKLWLNRELIGAQARALSENMDYILPARFDDTELPGLPPTIGFISLKDLTPTDFAFLIKRKLAPDDIDSLLEFVRIYKTQGKYNEAVALLQEVIKLGHTTVQAYTELAKVYQTQRRYDDAKEVLFECLRMYPRGLNSRIELARVYQAQKNYNEAERTLRESLAIDPNQLPARTELSKLYQRQKRWSEAEGILLESLRIDPGQIYPRTELSKIHQAQRRWSEAEKELREVLKLDLSNIQARIELSRLYQRQKRWSEAEGILLEVLKLDLENIQARTELARVYQTQKRYDDGEEILREALELDPNQLYPRTELARVYQIQKRYVEAEIILRELLQLDFNNLQARLELSRVYQAQRKYDEAEEILKESLAIDPNQLHPRTELSKIYQAQRKWSEAEGILFELLKLDPENLQARTELSRTYQRQRRWKEAEETLLELLKLDPHNLHARTELNRVYKSQNRYDEAEKIQSE